MCPFLNVYKKRWEKAEECKKKMRKRALATRMAAAWCAWKCENEACVSVCARVCVRVSCVEDRWSLSGVVPPFLLVATPPPGLPRLIPVTTPTILPVCPLPLLLVRLHFLLLLTSPQPPSFHLWNLLTLSPPPTFFSSLLFPQLRLHCHIFRWRGFLCDCQSDPFADLTRRTGEEYWDLWWEKKNKETQRDRQLWPPNSSECYSEYISVFDLELLVRL